MRKYIQKATAVFTIIATVVLIGVPAYATVSDGESAYEASYDVIATPSDPTDREDPEVTEEQKLFIEKIFDGEVDFFAFDAYGDYDEPLELATAQLAESLGFLGLSPVALVSPFLLLIFPPIGIAAAAMPIVGLGLTVVYSANLIFVAPIKELVWLIDNGYI